MKLKEFTSINPGIDLTGCYQNRVITQDDMLVTHMRLDCEQAVWNSIERFQVLTGTMISATSCSRRGIDLLNLALQNELHTIPIAAKWGKLGYGDGEIGMIPNYTYNIPLMLDIQSSERPKDEERMASVATCGYKLPENRNDLPDLRWFVQHRDEMVYTPAGVPTYYRFEPWHGVIMRVIFDGTPEPPYITLGPRSHTLVEPYEISPGAWLFDYTQDKHIVPTNPKQVPMRMLNTEVTANIEACITPPKEAGYVRVIAQQVYLVNYP